MARTRKHGKPLPKTAFARLTEGEFTQGKFDVTYDPVETPDHGFTYPMIVKLFRSGVNVVAVVPLGKGKGEMCYDATSEDGYTAWVPRVDKIREVVQPNGTESHP